MLPKFLFISAALALCSVGQCTPVNSAQDLLTVGNDDQNSVDSKVLNVVNDLLLRSSQLVALNNVEKKVDALTAYFATVNLPKLLQDFKQELLTEIKQTQCSNNGHRPLNDVNSLLSSGHNCTIKNRRYEELLFAAMGFDRDDERRRVFTWVDESKTYDQQSLQYLQSLWTLEKLAGEDNVYRIKSGAFDEYFYAGADDLKFDSERRNVFTWKPKTRCEEQCYWDIQLVKQPAGATNHYFTIRNTEYGEYFYSFDDAEQKDNPRRKVFTWKFDPHHNVQADYQSHWAIHCD